MGEANIRNLMTPQENQGFRCERTSDWGPASSANDPQHLSLVSGTCRKPAEQGGLRTPNRNGRILLRVSSAISGGICTARLWPTLHRFGFPVKQGRTGKNVHLKVKSGHLEPFSGVTDGESSAFSVFCAAGKGFFLLIARTGHLNPHNRDANRPYQDV